MCDTTYVAYFMIGLVGLIFILKRFTRFPSWNYLYQPSHSWSLLTDRRDPALALATDSFSLTAACRWIAWKLLSAAEKSFISRSLWIFCCLYTTSSRARWMVWEKVKKEESLTHICFNIPVAFANFLLMKTNSWKTIFLKILVKIQRPSEVEFANWSDSALRSGSTVYAEQWKLNES